MAVWHAPSSMKYDVIRKVGERHRGALAFFGFAVCIFAATYTIYEVFSVPEIGPIGIVHIPLPLATSTYIGTSQTNVRERSIASTTMATPPSVQEQVAPPHVDTATIAAPVSKPQTPTLENSARIGVAVGETLSVVSSEELARTLDDLASLGVGWVRADLAWSSVRPDENAPYRWDAFDRLVDAAYTRDIHVLPILTYTPAWARMDTCAWTSKCPPKDPRAFAVFVRDAIERYAPRGVVAWEVWNEPNISLFWASGADPERYAALLREAYTAVHDVSPDAVVVSGGLAPASTGDGNMAPRDFLEQLYTYGARTSFDAVGFHPYSYPLSPTHHKRSNAWSQMAETAWSIRSIMHDHGDGAKQVWLTEYGAPTGGSGAVAASDGYAFWDVPDHVTETYQAELMREAITVHATYPWAGPLFWYSYRDLGTTQEDKEHFFGLLRYDGTPKPAYEELARLLTE